MSAEAIFPVPIPVPETRRWTRKRQGVRHGSDRETNAVNRMVIHIANPMVKDMANKKHYGLRYCDWTIRGIDCKRLEAYNAVRKEASGWPSKRMPAFLPASS
jgi:hypothetical protein